MARRTHAETTPAPADPESIAIDTAWALWDQGRPSLAADRLLLVLGTRAAAGDRVAELCAQLLQRDTSPGWADDQADRMLAGALAELIALVEHQDAQIAALLSLTSP